ncbi:MAG: TRAM domain-containing protein [Acidimicrobiales bacterium]
MASVPQQHLHLRIEQVVAGGDGLARDDGGRVVFVPGVLPGERVAVRLVTAKRDFARGDVVEVLERSPWRVDPPCRALARGCGGCDWQHLDPAHQLEQKVAVATEALRRTARLADPVVEAGGSVGAWSYRTSMRVAVDRHGVPSLRRPRSNEPVTLEHCAVAHPALDELLRDGRFVGADEVSLRVSVATGERTAWWTRAHPGDEVRVSLPSDVRTGADAVVHEVVAGRRLRVSGASFFQSGPAAAELLVRTVRELVGPVPVDAHLVDAYGGVGLFATTLGVSHVTLVEGSHAACADAEVNLPAASVDGRVVCSSVESWRPDPARPAHVVVADPSRQGLGQAAVDVLASVGAPVLVLVGCDPVAFARDAGLLAARGYRLARAVALDLFPQTHHVEMVGRFER